MDKYPYMCGDLTGDLSDDDRREILVNDFVTWSGGFLPGECTLEQIRQYAISSRPSCVTHDEALNWLLKQSR